MSTPNAANRQHQSTARNPIVWLIVGLPAVVVVAAFATLAIAIRAGGSDALPDDVRRMAQIQTVDLGPDAYAAERKLSAVLRIGDNSIEVLPAGGEWPKTAEIRVRPLRLMLQHPTRAADDRDLRLQPTRDGWRIETALDPNHDWRVQLVDIDAHWRLHGRLPKAARSTLLQPAFDGNVAADSQRTP